MNDQDADTPLTEYATDASAWQFGRRQRHHRAWFNKASDLHAAAGVLWASLNPARDKELVAELGLGSGFQMRAALPSVYLMLWGMAMELGLKAILVANDEQVPKTHSLSRLAKTARVDFSEAEIGLLGILTESVIWDGKYPVPLDVTDYRRLDDLTAKLLYAPHNSIPGALRPNGALDWEPLNLLWARVITIYFGRAKARGD